MPQRRVHRPLAMTLAAAALTAVLTPVVTASAEPGLDAGAPQQVVSGEHLVAKPVFELPVSGYHLTARFGQTGLWSHAHTGLDFAAVTGTQIRSIAAGVAVMPPWFSSARSTPRRAAYLRHSSIAAAQRAIAFSSESSLGTVPAKMRMTGAPSSAARSIQFLQDSICAAHFGPSGTQKSLPMAVPETSSPSRKARFLIVLMLSVAASMLGSAGGVDASSCWRRQAVTAIRSTILPT